VAIGYAILSIPSVLGFWWPDGPNETQVRYAAFFDDDGLHEDLRIDRRFKSAECWTTSQSRPSNPFAARCLAGNTILDPCEMNSATTVGACAGAPWDRVVLVNRVVLRAAYSKKRAELFREAESDSLWNPQVRPWALELMSGEKCFFLQGAQSLTVGGVRRNYKCDSGFVIGAPDMAPAIWRAKHIKADAVATTDERVKIAWY